MISRINEWKENYFLSSLLYGKLQPSFSFMIKLKKRNILRQGTNVLFLIPQEIKLETSLDKLLI